MAHDTTFGSKSFFSGHTWALGGVPLILACEMDHFQWFFFGLFLSHFWTYKAHFHIYDVFLDGLWPDMVIFGVLKISYFSWCPVHGFPTCQHLTMCPPTDFENFFFEWKVYVQRMILRNKKNSVFCFKAKILKNIFFMGQQFK